MPLAIACPSCKLSFQVPDDLNGNVVTCMSCSKPFRIILSVPSATAIQPSRLTTATPPPKPVPSPPPVHRRVPSGLVAALAVALFVAAAGGGMWCFLAGKPPVSDSQPQVAKRADSQAEETQPATAAATRPQTIPAINPEKPSRPGAEPEPKPDGLSIETLKALKAATVYVRVAYGKTLLSGSGFVLRSEDDTAYVITNHHVLRAPKELKSPPKATITLVFDSGTASERSGPGEVLASDPERDLALLRVTGVKDLPVPLTVVQAPKLIETMPVFVFGFPFGEALSTSKGSPAVTVGKGAISGLRTNDKGKLARVQIEGDVNPGNSGGPLVDAEGRLIGIIVAHVPATRIGLAIGPEELGLFLSGRVVAAALFRKKINAGSTDLLGELWVYNTENAVIGSLARMLQKSMPGQNAQPDGAFAEVLVQAILLDPLGKLRSVTLSYQRANTIKTPPQPDKDGIWQALPDGTRAEMTVTAQKGETTLSLPVAPQAGDYYFQLAYETADGKTIRTQPRLFRVNRVGPATFPADPVVKEWAPPPFKIDPLLNGEGTKIYLKDMKEFEVKRGPWDFGKSHVGNPAQDPIKVKGVPSLNGLGMHPPSLGSAFVRYALGQKAKTFEGAVAFNDTNERAGPSPVTFIIWGDGKELWRSDVLKARGEKQEFSVDVRTVDVLQLEVNAAGSSFGSHAVWIEPRVLTEVPADGIVPKPPTKE